MLSGWKTLAVMGGSFLMYAFEWPELTQHVDPQTLAMGTAAVGLFLRFITHEPVGIIKMLEKSGR